MITSNMSTTKSTSLDHRDELSKVISDLKSMYNRGVPWFTKEGIENVKRQMEKTAANIEEFPIIKFVGLNGKEVEVNFHRLANMYTHNSGGDLMLTNLVIRYNLFQDMTGHFEYDLPFRGEEFSYLPLEVAWQERPVCPPTQHLPQPTAPYFEGKLHDKKKEWEATSEYKMLQTLVASNPEFSRARKIFGIALGSMRATTEINRQNSTAQYCLLQSMGELIAKAAQSNEICCFAQDPDLSPPVIEALSNIGIQTIDDPQAFLDLDDTSVVITSAPNIPVMQIVTDLARPVAIMWHPPSENDKNILTTDPTSPRVDAMIENEYICLEFPKYEPFHGIELYVRKGKERRTHCGVGL